MKDKDNVDFDKVISDISILYELSLAVGQSLDLKTSCDRFLKPLMARKNLGYASVWIKREYLIDPRELELFEEGDQNSAFLIYAYPQFRIKDKCLPLNHPIFSLLKCKEAFSISSSEDRFSEIITEKGINKGTFAIFALGQLGFLKLFSMTGETPLGEEGLNQLKNVISKFAVSLEGCLAHQSLIHEINERKQAEEMLRRSEAAATQLAKENATVAEIGRIISSTLNINEVYERFAEEVRKLIPFERININIIAHEGKTSTSTYSAGTVVPGRKVGAVFQLAASAAEEVMRTRSGLILHPMDKSELEGRFPGLLPAFEAGQRSMMTVPLISNDKVIGALYFGSTRLNAYTESDLSLAESIGTQIAGAMANAQLFSDQIRAEEALLRSEERFRELYDKAPVGYHEFDTEGRITSVNRTEMEMMGYRLEEMLGQPVWKFSVEEEISRQQILAKLAGTLPPSRDLERTQRRKDGSTFPALIVNSLLRDRTGKTIGIRSTLQDVTERKKAEQEKEVLVEQLRQSQKMEAIGRLAGGIAHDFNNLLTVIKGYSQLSLAETREYDPIRGNIEEIERASDRAADLTRQLLAFSRRHVLDLKVLDLNTLLKDFDKMLRRILGEDIELVMLFAEGLGKVKTDPGQIEQVMMNLAVNARDAMPAGGKLIIETANVELDEAYTQAHISTKPGRYVRVSVSDTGTGMSREVMDHIFEPFFTTKGKGKGTGLGLSTVYGIVKQSGGNIWTYSELDLGTTFKIYLPRVEEEADSLPRRDEIGYLPRGNEIILLVEDEASLRSLAARILQAQGYRVLEAAHGEEALRIAQESTGQDLHLLLTDVVMPQMGGKELVGRLKKLRPEIKVLFISGYTDNIIISHDILGPNTAFLQKPFSIGELVRRVREILDR